MVTESVMHSLQVGIVHNSLKVSAGQALGPSSDFIQPRTNLVIHLELLTHGPNNVETVSTCRHITE
jgi:hypothetical protein